MDELIKIPDGELKEIIRLAGNIKKEVNHNGEFSDELIQDDAESIIGICNKWFEYNIR